MRKFIASAVTAAALIAGGQSVQAAPLLTMSITNSAADAAQCAAGTGGAGVFTAGGTCTFTNTTGTMAFVGLYGTFNALNIIAGRGNGSDPLSLEQPALWLAPNVSTSLAGVLEITLVASGYDSPSGTFPLLSTVSSTVNGGLNIFAEGFFDAGDTGVAGAGDSMIYSELLGSTTVSGGVPLAVNNVENLGTYSESWIMTIERLSGGAPKAVGVNATFDLALPGPATLGILGLGLVGLSGFMSRRRRVS